MVLPSYILNVVLYVFKLNSKTVCQVGELVRKSSIAIRVRLSGGFETDYGRVIVSVVATVRIVNWPVYCSHN